ncbi:AlpA family phage regulatory protein [Aquitalea sp. S1-19]|nr:AlpA family phage regulatory protein [Aquitalea sp. S1-19]
MLQKHLRPAQVAARYSVTRVTIYRWVNRDPSFPRPRKIGGATLFSIAELDAWDALHLNNAA